MSKQSGLGDALFVAGRDISGDTGSLSRIGQPRAMQDVTGIDKSAHERIYGLRDGEITFNSFFNDSLLHEHAILSPLPTADVICTYLRGTTLGGNAAAMVAKQVNYDPTRSASGFLTIDTQMLANGYGLEWGQTLTAGKRTDTTATAPATGVNFASAANPTSAAFGLAAYLHVFSITGTSVTFTIQDSANDSAYAGITGLTAFGPVLEASAPYSERIETDLLTRTVRQYLKVNTTGTFTECTFAVIVVRYGAENREG